jgi:phosphatidate cytidylyltransferase
MFGLLSYAFGGIVTLLVTASVTTATLMRVHPARNYVELKLRIQTWWWLAAILFLALSFNRTVGVVVLAVVSFMAFKEFISLIPTRPIDNAVLLLAYLAIPVQYLWVNMAWYGMFIIFIPVYVFCSCRCAWSLPAKPAAFCGPRAPCTGG